MKIKYNVSIFIILLLCAVCFAFPTLAVKEQSYSLPDLKMNISVDDSLSVITRDSAENDPAFEDFGLTYNEAMKNFTDSGLYLEGISSDGGYILTVAMSKDTNSQAVVSYGRLDDDEMSSLCAGFLSNGIYTDAQTAEINGNRYIVLPFTQTQGDITLYGIQYNTVENGMNINITLHTATAPLSDNTLWLIEDAVRSIEFTEKAESVSSFKPVTVILWLLFAIIVLGGAAVLITGLVRRKRLPVQGGFDTPKNGLFGFNRDKEEQPKEPPVTRQQVIENINHGGDYDVFSDADAPQPEQEKPAFFKNIFKGKKK